MLIQMAQWDTVIKETEVTSSRFEPLAQMAHYDEISTSGRHFQTKRYI